VPTRTHRRTLRDHRGLKVVRRELGYDSEHYELYLRYQRSRHPGGGMDHDSREQYQHFLLHSNVTTDLFEFRRGSELKMISLVDRLEDGLSSVYTFYNADERGTSYGTFSVLWQIERCRALGLDYLYLGYWIEQSTKMAYKASFQPIEGLAEGRWAILGEHAIP
jgi:arginine-tRNA-protein transferase